VHCHRERGGGVRVVSIGTCRADLKPAVAVQGGVFGPRPCRMDHHLFRIGYLYLVKVVEHRQYQLRQGRHRSPL
jgi:hypothetical protein